MQVRVTAGIGAWIVGATTATGLSLFAVSFLGADPHSPQGTTLSPNQVNQALASISGTLGGATTTDPAPPDPDPTPTATGSTDRHGSSMTSTHDGPSTPSTTTAHLVERRLFGDGGAVVAQCQGSTVYLVTWSPAQGYQAEALQRGPAHDATVVFTGYGNRITFHVSCPGGVPTATVNDDGGIDH